MSAKTSKGIKAGTILATLLGGAVYLRDTVVANQGRITAAEAINTRQDVQIDRLDERQQAIIQMRADIQTLLAITARVEKRMDELDRKLAMMPIDTAMAMTAWCQLETDGEPCSYMGSLR